MVTYDSGSDTAGNEPITLTARAEGEPGELTIEGQVEGSIGAGVGDLLSGFNRDTIKIRFIPTVANELKEKVNNQFSSVGGGMATGVGAAGSLPTSVSRFEGKYIPKELKSIPTVSKQLTTKVFGQKVGGHSPIGFSRSVSYTPIKVPQIKESQISVDELPPLRLDVEVVPTEFIQRVGEGISGSFATVTLEIPPSAFIQKKQIEDMSCSEIYTGVSSKLNDLETKVSDVKPRVNNDLNTLQDYRDTLVNQGGLKEKIKDSTSISELSTNELKEMDANRLKEIKSNIQKIDPSTYNISSLKDKAESIQEKVSDKVGEACVSEFMPRVKDVISTLNTLEGKVEKIRDIRSKLLSLLSDISSVREKALTCADVPREVRNAVSGFEASVNSFVSKRVYRRTPSRYAELTRQGRNVIEEVRTEVRKDNPCRDELISRIKESMERLKNSGTIPKDQLPCSEKHPGLDSRIDEFQSSVADLTSGNGITTPQEVQAAREVANRGEELLQDIRRATSAGSHCRKEMVERVRSSVERVTVPRNRIRVKTNINNGQVSQAREDLEALRQQLKEISEAAGGGGSMQ